MHRKTLPARAQRPVMTAIAAATLAVCAQPALAQTWAGSGGGPGGGTGWIDGSAVANPGTCDAVYCGGGAGGSVYYDAIGVMGGHGSTNSIDANSGRGGAAGTGTYIGGSAGIGASIGGAGGKGNDGAVNSEGGSGGGGGGGGGIYILGADGSVYTTHGDISGGAGGAGGVGQAASPSGDARGGGGGGAGGSALVFSHNSTITNSHVITGGRGGDGGAGSIDTAGGERMDGHAGQGGHAIVMNQGGTVINEATGVIRGGDGGDSTYDDGRAGIAILGRGVHVINKGRIEAGRAGANADAGPLALQISGGSVLEIHAGSTIVGRVDGDGADLRLGGDIDGTFDMNRVGDGAQFQYDRFSEYQKSGNSVWTLTGTATDPRRWSVLGGTLVGSTQTLIDDIRNDGKLVLDQDFDGTLAGTISGTGSLIKTGTGTVGTGFTHSYTGPTEIRGGMLQVNGALVSDVSVFAGGTLAGSGQMPKVTVYDGGILRPQSSSRALRITGDLTFHPGATLQVWARPDSGSGRDAGQVTVGGTATLAGTFALSAEAGEYNSGTQHKVLLANTINGKFSATRSNLAYLEPKLTYGDNEIIMTVERVTANGDSSNGGGGAVARFEDAVSTPNQRAAARGVESLPASHPLYRYVESLPQGAPTAVMQSLSGEVHASSSSAAQAVSGVVRGLTLQHMRNNLMAGMSAGAPTAAAGLSDAAPSAASLPRSNAQPAWAELVGNWQTFKGDANTAQVRQHTGGVFVGMDRDVGGGWRLGGALGVTDSNLSAGSLESKADVSGYSASIYGGKRIAAGPGTINVMGGVAYTWSDISTKRHLYGAGLDQTLTADYGASTVQIFTEAGYAYDAGAGLTLEPFAGVAWSDQRTRGFSETGGFGAVSGRSRSDTVTTTSLGLRAQQAFTLAGRDWQANALAGWRHAFGDVRPDSVLAFDGGAAFTVSGNAIARDAALVGLGLRTTLTRNSSVGVAYNGEFGGGNREHSAVLNVRWQF